MVQVTVPSSIRSHSGFWQQRQADQMPWLCFQTCWRYLNTELMHRMRQWWNNVQTVKHSAEINLFNSTVTAKFETQPAVRRYLLPKDLAWGSPTRCGASLESLFQGLFNQHRYNVTCGLMLTLRKRAQLSVLHYWPEWCCSVPKGPTINTLSVWQGHTESDSLTHNLSGSAAPCG